MSVIVLKRFSKDGIRRNGAGYYHQCPLCKCDVLTEGVHVQVGMIWEFFKCSNCKFEWKEEIDLSENSVGSRESKSVVG